MTRVARVYRPVNGILLLDKPTGESSNRILQKVKRIFTAKKAGHTGSLDPLASGMLPICFGEATKFSQFLLESDKTYEVTAQLGVRTTTSDSEGEAVSERPVPTFSIEQLNTALDQFRGETNQVPSMFSALKYQGQPLYKLARQGITVDRPSRPINVYRLELLNFDGNSVELLIHCSKGTYVRTIVDDFGELLGCGAHVTKLRRLTVGAYVSEQMISMQQLENDLDNNEVLDRYLLPFETAVDCLPKVELTESMVRQLHQGQSIILPATTVRGLVRVISQGGYFVGVGEILEDACLVSRRLISQAL